MLIYNMQPVQEAYFGKTKNLLEAEKIIKSIVKKFKVPFDKIGKRMIDAAELNKSSENKKLQELFKKEFGFGEMYIHWDGSETVNAFSFSRGIIKLIDSDMPKLPVKQSDGGYYDSGHNYLCVVNLYSGLIDAGLTAEEIMAIILHEIGHNFQCTPITNMTTFTDIVWIPINLFKTVQYFSQFIEAIQDMVGLIGIGSSLKDSGIKIPSSVNKQLSKTFASAFMVALTATYYVIRFGQRTIDDAITVIYKEIAPKEYKKYFEEFDQFILKNKNKVLVEWKKYVETYRKRMKVIESDKDRIAWGSMSYIAEKVLQAIFEDKILTIEDIYKSQTGYSGEVFADSFATAYGYGGALSSSQVKFEKKMLSGTSFALNKENKYSTLNQYSYVMLQLVVSFFDPHPMNITRIKNQVNKLKRELDSDEIPPSLKNQIRKDLDDATKAYEEFLAMPEGFRHLSVVYNFHHFNEMYFGGKLEIRDFINRVLNLGMAEA